MKNNKKCITLIITTLLMMLLLTGCGNGSASSTHTAANIDGQTVSYGPITLTLPQEYTLEEKYPNYPVYYAKERDDVEYKPNIRFVTDSGTVTSNADVNEENYIAHEKELIGIMEDSEFKEMVSYEESELGGYKVIKAQTKEVIYGRPLVVECCKIYEKVGSSGVVIQIKYDGLESDTEHLSDFEACLDTISLKTDMNKSGSDWQRTFYFKSRSTGSPLYISGNFVEYGPLQMMLPDGYTVEDDAAESPVFSAADGSSFNVRFTDGSYQQMFDKAYAENLWKEELEGQGITDVSVIHYEAIRISGYDGYEIGIQASSNGQSLIEFIYMVFETADEDMTPAFVVTYAASEEVARNMTEEVDKAFNSIRWKE